MFECGFELASTNRFQYVADRAGFKRLNSVFIVCSREDYRGWIWQGVEVMCRFYSADPGHSNIQQYDIGLRLRDDRYSLFAIARLTCEIVAVNFIDDLSQTLACRALVVDDQYLHGRISSAGNRSRTE